MMWRFIPYHLPNNERGVREFEFKNGDFGGVVGLF